MGVYCVTGGTGFIAAYIVKSLLEKGHTVRTTVRDPENAEKVGFLWELNGAKERLKMFKADLMLEGSFNQAIQGADENVQAKFFNPLSKNSDQKLGLPPLKPLDQMFDDCIKSFQDRGFL